jgi:hypothetical protein
MTIAQPRTRQRNITRLISGLLLVSRLWPGRSRTSRTSRPSRPSGTRPRRSLGDPRAWAPMPAIATGATDRDVAREVDQIARAVSEVGQITEHGLINLVGARYWGPGRFRRALKSKRIRRIRRSLLGGELYGPA